MTKPQITFYQVHKYQCSVVLFDQVVGVPLFPFSNVISLTLHLSDHIKRLPLFLFSSMRKTWIPSNSSWLLKQAFNLVSKWKYVCQIKFSNNEFLCCLVFICVRKNDNVFWKNWIFCFLFFYRKQKSFHVLLSTRICWICLYTRYIWKRMKHFFVLANDINRYV